MSDNRTMASAVDLKNQGNDAFAKKDYVNAIALFTQATALDPQNHVLYSNRSASYAGIQVDDSIDIIC